MRSTRFSLQLLVAGLAAFACVVSGCSNDSASTYADSPAATLNDQGSNNEFPQKPIADAAPPKASPYRGNPLCQTGPSTCMPDDDGYRRSLANEECATPPAGAIDGSAGADYVSKGCRIAPGDGGSIGPQCLVATLGGGDGASCGSGGDCAPGFDCVVGEKGTKTCRHYCCSGTCKGNLSNGGATFCDVQTLVEVNKAPVCMPIKRCSKLLGTGECAINESCTVVTEGGDTGCVVIGDQQVGESCDESHCAAKLTCLGQPGARKCFKLCKLNASDCPSSQTCVTSAAFKDADFGICL